MKTYEIVNHVGRVVRSFTSRKKAMARAKRYAHALGAYSRVDLIRWPDEHTGIQYTRRTVREYGV